MGRHRKLPAEPFYRGMGERIYLARTHARMTQQALGDALGMKAGRQTVCNMESGKQRILAHTIAMLAIFLKRPPSYFYGAKP